MEHLALEIFDLPTKENPKPTGSKYANLPEDVTITVTDTSEIFASGDVWSFPFTLNVRANAHIFGTAGEIHGSRLHEQINKRRTRLWAEGLPLYLGYLKLDDEVDVDENGDVDVTFESGQKTFEEMIEGAKANQVPIPDDILIGMALERQRDMTRSFASVVIRNRSIFHIGPPSTLGFFTGVSLEGVGAAQELPKFVRPYGTWTKVMAGGYTYEVIKAPNSINTHSPYDSAHPYCNVAVCYQKKEWKDNNGTLEKQNIRDYQVSMAGRINPAPNFYVLYWLDMLMKHLGIIVKENQMMDVEDLRRLFFVNTKCAYRTKGEDIYMMEDYTPYGPESPFVPTPEDDNPSYELNIEILNPEEIPSGYRNMWAEIYNVGTGLRTSVWKKAFATSDNFPNVDISDVIESLESGFGARFLFNRDCTQVRVVLLRNIFCSSNVQTILCDIVKKPIKVDNAIRGFRMTYGGNKDDTAYQYKGFLQERIRHKEQWVTEVDEHDYSQFNFSLRYTQIVEQVNMLNKTCYIDSSTGNAYIVKIDKNYKDASDNAYPALFECHQWADAEDGDCTGELDTIDEVTVKFTPMDGNYTGDGYALFVDEEMSVPWESRFNLNNKPNYGNESLDFDNKGCTNTKKEAVYQSGLFEVATKIQFVAKDKQGSDVFSVPTSTNPALIKISGKIREGYRLYLQDNYEINDEMLCPLERPDWGLTFGIMRGANVGTDIKIVYESDADDNEGNDTWHFTGGLRGDVSSDSCSPSGKIWGGSSPKNSVSLKLRAEKPNPNYGKNDEPQYLTITNPNLRGRGLCDQFYKEYSYWVRNARIAKLQVYMDFAQLLTIDKTMKVKVGDIIGFIRKMEYDINSKTGLGLVTMEIMYL